MGARLEQENDWVASFSERYKLIPQYQSFIDEGTSSPHIRPRLKTLLENGKSGLFPEEKDDAEILEHLPEQFSVWQSQVATLPTKAEQAEELKRQIGHLEQALQDVDPIEIKTKKGIQVKTALYKKMADLYKDLDGLQTTAQGKRPVPPIPTTASNNPTAPRLPERRRQTDHSTPITSQPTTTQPVTNAQAIRETLARQRQTSNPTSSSILSSSSGSSRSPLITQPVEKLPEDVKPFFKKILDQVAALNRNQPNTPTPHQNLSRIKSMNNPAVVSDPTIRQKITEYLENPTHKAIIGASLVLPEDTETAGNEYLKRLQGIASRHINPDSETFNSWARQAEEAFQELGGGHAGLIGQVGAWRAAAEKLKVIEKANTVLATAELFNAGTPINFRNRRLIEHCIRWDQYDNALIKTGLTKDDKANLKILKERVDLLGRYTSNSQTPTEKLNILKASIQQEMDSSDASRLMRFLNNSSCNPFIPKNRGMLDDADGFIEDIQTNTSEIIGVPETSHQTQSGQIDPETDIPTDTTPNQELPKLVLKPKSTSDNQPKIEEYELYIQ